MELKNYFKKFGKGWIFLGFAITLLGLFLAIHSLLTSETKTRVDPATWQKYVLEEVLYLVLICTLALFVPFLFGFFGYIHLFWSMMAGLGISVIIGLLNSGSTDSSGGIARVFILILSFIIGVVLQSIKNASKSQKG